MEKALLLQNPHWYGEHYDQLISRNAFDSIINKLSLREIQVLLGARRAGKSTVFQLVINHLMKDYNPKSIVYLNLDDPYYATIWDDPKMLHEIAHISEKITDTKPGYLFLDEIQNVHLWERYVKSVYDAKLFKKIFVTGSNAALLKGHCGKLLSGRYVADYIYPLSYREILAHVGIKTTLDLLRHKAQAVRLAETMLLYGSFPEVYKTSDLALKRELLLSYYETILLKDCILTHNIRDTKTIQDLALYLLTNNSALYSYNGLAEFLNSNDNTIKEFIHIFERSFLLDELKKFSYSLKQQTKTKKKSYCVDNGLIQAVAIKFSENKGKLFENLVFTELKKSPHVQDIYYYCEDNECDFIVKYKNEWVAIQVCLELNKGNRVRELQGLHAVIQKFSIQQGYIVTFNQEEQIDSKVGVVPFWSFFFNL